MALVQWGGSAAKESPEEASGTVEEAAAKPGQPLQDAPATLLLSRGGSLAARLGDGFTDRTCHPTCSGLLKWSGFPANRLQRLRNDPRPHLLKPPGLPANLLGLLG